MMRELFLLFLILGACIALEDPPVQEVLQHNKDIANSLMGGASIPLDELTVAEPARVNMSIVDALPTVDGRIPPDAEGVLWAWNERNADGLELIEEDTEHGCDDRYLVTLINRTEYVEMEFSFRNETRGGEISTANPIVAIPFGEEELETANGTENLTVHIKWNYWYFFEVIVTNNVWRCEGSGENQTCSCNSEPDMSPPRIWDIVVVGNTSKQFIIEPGEAEFFLARPVLGEQWYQNNHFDTLIFSRKSIYKAEISMDGNKTAYARIYNFTVLEDPMGAWHIAVEKEGDFRNASMGNYELAYWATPVVKGNNPFSHLYEVNHTYEAWGPHMLRVEATDFFGGTHEYSKEILSRKLTAGGTSETGEMEGSNEYYRPSAPKADGGELVHVLLPSSSAILIFLVAALGMFWYYKRSAGGG